MAKNANFHKNSTWYFVDFFSEKSYCEKWKILTPESSVSHKRVFRISADKFYDLVTQKEGTLEQLNQKLPIVIEECYLAIS
jgi:hypothetical protein